MLRHSFAVHYLEGGAAITDLQSILGHSNLATTQRYAKMVEARRNESLRTLDYGLTGGEIHDSQRTPERTPGPDGAGSEQEGADRESA